MGAAGRTGTSGPNRGSRCSAPGPPAADRQDESPGRGRALRRQLGGYGGDGSPNGVNQRQGGLRSELDSDASRGRPGWASGSSSVAATLAGTVRSAAQAGSTGGSAAAVGSSLDRTWSGLASAEDPS